MIYFLQHSDTGLIKIGTTRNYYNRYNQLKSQHGDLELLGVLDGSFDIESEVHSKFSECRDDSAGGREWFKPTPELLKFIETETRNQEPINKFTVVQVNPETHELLKLLQQKHQTKSMWQAVRQLLLDTLSDEEIEAARNRAVMRAEYLKSLRGKKR